MEPEPWLILLLLLISCFYAACESSLRTFNRAKLAERLQLSDDKKHWLVECHQPFILVCGFFRVLVHLLLFLILLDWMSREAIQSTSLFDRFQLVTPPTLITLLLISIFNIAIPASLVRYHPEIILSRSRHVLRLSYFLSYPVIVLLTYLDPFVRRVTAGTEPTDDDLEENVLSVVEEHEEGGHIDETQKAIIEAVFELPEIMAGEIMTPRTDLSAVNIESDLEQIKREIMETGYSRMPVYQENVDQIKGILYAKDLIQFVTGDEQFEIEKCMRKPMMVPESKPIGELLSEFRDEKVHIAVVLDEYGGTAGIITIEDILEELVGEIEDEYEEAETPKLQKIDDTLFEIEARIEIDDLNEALDLDLPEDEDYETVGGFVFSELGHIPVEGEQLNWRNICFTVLDAQSNRINRLQLKLMARPNEKSA